MGKFGPGCGRRRFGVSAPAARQQAGQEAASQPINVSERGPTPAGAAAHPIVAPSLPCTDSKKVGAADFYFTINATFRFIDKEFGRDGLRRYWQELGSRYYAPVSVTWKRGGLPAVAEYWRAFFAAEPGAEVGVEATPEEVRLDVRVCPAFKHLRAHDREVVSCFCQHCYYISEAMAAQAGLTVRVEGGNGACRQTFLPRRPGLPPQDLARVKEAT